MVRLVDGNSRRVAFGYLAPARMAADYRLVKLASSGKVRFKLMCPNRG